MCSGSVSLQDKYNSSYMLGPIEVTPDNQDNSIRFMIPSSRENLNQLYNATFTLDNSAGSATSNIIISELYIYYTGQSGIWRDISQCTKYFLELKARENIVENSMASL